MPLLPKRERVRYLSCRLYLAALGRWATNGLNSNLPSSERFKARSVSSRCQERRLIASMSDRRKERVCRGVREKWKNKDAPVVLSPSGAVVLTGRAVSLEAEGHSATCDGQI